MRYKKISSSSPSPDLPIQTKTTLTSASFEQAWQAGQNQLVSLLPNTQHIIARKSNHYIQASQPELIITAIHNIVNSIRTSKK